MDDLFQGAAPRILIFPRGLAGQPAKDAGRHVSWNDYSARV